MRIRFSIKFLLHGIALACLVLGTVMAVLNSPLEWYPASVAYSPDGKLLAVCFHTGGHPKGGPQLQRVRVWNLAAEQPTEIPLKLNVPRNYPGYMGGSIQFVDEMTVAVPQLRDRGGGQFEIWDITEDRRETTIATVHEFPYFFGWSHSERTLVHTQFDRVELSLLTKQGPNWETLDVIFEPIETPRGMQVSADGTFMAFGTDASAELWSISPIQRIATIPLPEPARVLAISPNNKYLCTSTLPFSRTYSCRVTLIPTGEKKLELEMPYHVSTEFSPITNRLAILSRWHYELWDLEKQERVVKLDIDGGRNLGFAPHESQIAILRNQDISLCNPEDLNRDFVVWRARAKDYGLLWLAGYYAWFVSAFITWRASHRAQETSSLKPGQAAMARIYSALTLALLGMYVFLVQFVVAHFIHDGIPSWVDFVSVVIFYPVLFLPLVFILHLVRLACMPNSFFIQTPRGRRIMSWTPRVQRATWFRLLCLGVAALLTTGIVLVVGLVMRNP